MEYKSQRLYRDASIFSIYEGTTPLQVVAAIRYISNGTMLNNIKDMLAALPAETDTALKARDWGRYPSRNRRGLAIVLSLAPRRKGVRHGRGVQPSAEPHNYPDHFPPPIYSPAAVVAVRLSGATQSRQVSPDA